jgi:hypothetical protein
VLPVVSGMGLGQYRRMDHAEERRIRRVPVVGGGAAGPMAAAAPARGLGPGEAAIVKATYGSFRPGSRFARGVERHEGRIVEVMRSGETGFVEAVALVDGRRLAADFGIDCAGAVAAK